MERHALLINILGYPSLFAGVYFGVIEQSWVLAIFFTTFAVFSGWVSGFYSGIHAQKYHTKHGIKETPGFREWNKD